ncbi:MAG: hypothetical protein LBU03_00405 [Tannerellaceae bacterium]|jgi:uncharacterized protein YjdB|nr:hypothetical protein [Tannerellaceae bacterium]
MCANRFFAVWTAIVALVTVPVVAVAQQGITLLHNLPSDTLSCDDILVVTAVSSQVGSSFSQERDPVIWGYDENILELVDTENDTVWKFRPLVADTFATIVVKKRGNPDVYGVLHLEIRPTTVTRIYVTDEKKKESATIAVNGSPLSLTIKVETRCSQVEFIGRMKIDGWIIEPKDWDKGAGIEFVDDNKNASQRSIRAKANGYATDSTKVIVVYRQEPTATYPISVFLRDTFYVSVAPVYVSRITLRDSNGKEESRVRYDESVTLRAMIEPSDATDNSMKWECDKVLLDSVAGPGDNEFIFSPRGIGVTTISVTALSTLPSSTVKPAVYTLHAFPNVTLTDENGKTDTTIHRHGTVKLTAKIAPDNVLNQDLSWEIPQGLDLISPVQEDGKRIIQPTKSDTAIKVRVKIPDESGIEEAVYTVKILPVSVATIELVDADGGTSTIANRGDTVSLTATAFPTDAVNKKLVWDIVPNTELVKFVSLKKSGNINGIDTGVVIKQGDASIEVKVSLLDDPKIGASYYISALPVSVNSLSLYTYDGDTMQQGERLTLYAELTPQDAVDRRVEWSFSPSDAVKFVDVSEERPYERTIEALQPNTDVKITVKTLDGIFVDRRVIHIERSYLEGVSLRRTDMEEAPVNSTLRSFDNCYLQAIIDPENVTNPEVSWQAEGDVAITPSKSDPLRCLIEPKYSNTKGRVTVTVKTDAGEQKQASHTFVVPLEGLSLKDLAGKTDSIVDLGKTSLPTDVTLKPFLLKVSASPVEIKEDYSNIDWKILTPEYAYFDEDANADADIFPCRRLWIFEDVTGGDIRVLLSAKGGSESKAIYTLTIKPVGVQSLIVKDKKGLSTSNVEKGDTIEFIADYTPTSIIHPELEWNISPTGAAEFISKNPAYKEWESAVRVLKSDTTITVTVVASEEAVPIGERVKASYLIMVPPIQVDSIALTDTVGSPLVTELKNGEEITLKGNVFPADADNKQLAWDYEPKAVASLLPASDGISYVLKALQPDTQVTVTVQSRDGSEITVSHVVRIRSVASSVIDTELPSGTDPFAFYRQGNLYLRNAEGYLCYITTLTGRLVTVFRETTPASVRPCHLSRGVYVFTVLDGSRKFVFKFFID